MGYEIVNYIDDFGGANKSHRADGALPQLGSLLTELGVEDFESKAVPLSTELFFLGIHFNSVTMAMSIPFKKMRSKMS